MRVKISSQNFRLLAVQLALLVLCVAVAATLLIRNCLFTSLKGLATHIMTFQASVTLNNGQVMKGGTHSWQKRELANRIPGS